MKNFIKKNWFGLLTAVLSFLIFSITLRDSGGFSGIFEILKDADKFWIFVAVLFVVIYWFMDGMILHIFILTHVKVYSRLLSIKTAIIGLLYSALTPFAIGGQPMMVYMMAKSDVEEGDAAGIVTIKSIIFQIVMVFYSILAIFTAAYFFANEIDNFALYVTGGLILNGLFIFFILLICFHKKFIKRAAYFLLKLLFKLKIIKNFKSACIGVNKQINIFAHSISSVKKHKKTVVIAVFFTLFQLLSYNLIPYCIYRSFNLTGADAMNMFFANSLITMIIAFIPLPGGSGAAEGSSYLFFKLFFTEKLIFPAVFIWRFITYFLCIIVGMGISIFDVIKSFRNRKKS